MDEFSVQFDMTEELKKHEAAFEDEIESIKKVLPKVCEAFRDTGAAVLDQAVTQLEEQGKVFLQNEDTLIENMQTVRNGYTVIGTAMGNL